MQVDLWYWPLSAPAAPVLSADEEARAARFVRSRDFIEWRAARAGLRARLAGYTGQTPGALRFDTGPQGKPFLPGGPAFNLSHSGGWAALAVTAPGATLGLDIEAHRAVEPELAERFFAPAETAALAGLSGAAWQVAFFRLWTRKEALVKALGCGLSRPLDSFDVTAGPEARLTRLAGGSPGDWHLADLAPGPDMQGALALLTQGRPVEIRLREGRQAAA